MISDFFRALIVCFMRESAGKLKKSVIFAFPDERINEAELCFKFVNSHVHKVNGVPCIIVQFDCVF